MKRFFLKSSCEQNISESVKVFSIEEIRQPLDYGVWILILQRLTFFRLYSLEIDFLQTPLFRG